MTKHPQQPLLDAVEKFLDATEMAPTTFGREAVNDVNLVAQLREGREVRSRTQEKIFCFIGSRSIKAPDVSCLSKSSGNGKVNVQGPENTQGGAA